MRFLPRLRFTPVPHTHTRVHAHISVLHAYYHWLRFLRLLTPLRYLPAFVGSSPRVAFCHHLLRCTPLHLHGSRSRSRFGYALRLRFTGYALRSLLTPDFIYFIPGWVTVPYRTRCTHTRTVTVLPVMPAYLRTLQCIARVTRFPHTRYLLRRYCGLRFTRTDYAFGLHTHYTTFLPAVVLRLRGSHTRTCSVTVFTHTRYAHCCAVTVCYGSGRCLTFTRTVTFTQFTFPVCVYRTRCLRHTPILPHLYRAVDLVPGYARVYYCTAFTFCWCPGSAVARLHTLRTFTVCLPLVTFIPHTYTRCGYLVHVVTPHALLFTDSFYPRLVLHTLLYGSLHGSAFRFVPFFACGCWLRGYCSLAFTRLPLVTRTTFCRFPFYTHALPHTRYRFRCCAFTAVTFIYSCHGYLHLPGSGFPVPLRLPLPHRTVAVTH